MTKRDTAILGIRFASFYAFFQSLEFFAGGVVSFFFAQNAALGHAGPWTSMAFLFPSVLFAVIGVLLFINAPQLANRFLSGSDNSSGLSTNSSASPSVGFAIVGLVGFLYSVPRIVPIIISLLQSDQFSDPNAKQVFFARLPQMAGVFLQIVLSFAVLLKSQALAAWWQRKQTQPAKEDA